VAPRQTLSVAGIAIGLGLVLLGGVIGFDAVTMRVPPTYAKIGPHIFPIVVAAGFLITGLLIAYTAVMPSREAPVVAADAPTDWRAVAIVAAALIVNALLLKTLGFVITAWALFIIVAFALGSRRYLRDITIGAALALVTYFGFTRGLGLQLPSGIFAGVF
jgi:putative tricarboxylic transport membrane protein